SGLYYNRFRYYDKETGQYLSPDPIGLLGGFNPYGYVHCPTGYIDPFGLACCFFAKNPKQAHAIIQEKWGHAMSKRDMRELQLTVDRIKLNQPKYSNDGKIFENNHQVGNSNSQRLDTGSGPYKEWTVKTPDVGTNGARRIVVDTKSGKAYYTHDHYDSFIEIDLKGWK
ncbi:RHS repeat-associated core domain-containing protein, partial [Proteus mirabilis]